MSKPILFMKTGVLRSEPLGFYARLADQFDAVDVSTDEIRRSFGRSDRRRTPALTRVVNDEAQRQAAEALQSGANVFYDGFLNQLMRREQVRADVVAPAGAISVLLCVIAPMRVIRDRIVEKFETEHPGIPSDDAKIVLDNIRKARQMMRYNEWPLDSEQALRLDGMLPVPELIEEVSLYVQTAEIH